MTEYQTLFPERGRDLPIQVHGFLRLCELANTWYEWQDEHWEENKAYFCEGVVDYWYDDDVEEPRWEQLFYTDFESGELRKEPMPSVGRFSYQQGAIIGYRLRKEYKNA